MNAIKQEPSDAVAGIDAQISLKRQTPARKRGWFAWLIRACLRLTVWFCIYTVVFRCPAAISDLDESSSLVCRPYLEAKLRLSPHIRPYYDAHAAPYVDAAWPYVQVANDKVLSPALTFGKQGYDRYGAPQVSKAFGLAKTNWDKTAKPRLDVLTSRVQDQYDKSLGPVVQQAYDISAPYYSIARKTVDHHIHATALPIYRKSLPHLQRAFLSVQRFSTTIILPYARYCTDVTLQFITREAWPRLRILYGQNVEPQLVKIRERLANYRDAKNIEAAVEEITSSSSTLSSTSSVVSTSVTADESTQVEETATSDGAMEETPSPLPPASDPVQETQRKVSEDLKIWQEKFAKASDRGSEELKDRVAKIASHQIDGQVKGVGEALIIQLEETVSSGTDAVQKAIIQAAQNLAEDAEESEVEAAVAEARAAVRGAGQQIKEKAQRVRSWKMTYNKDLSQLVQNSLDSTLDVVDNIRDLGLQEIGMRWAAMDGVTYQDWEEYHTLKKSFDNWRTSIETVPVNHAALADARQQGEDIESQAMAIAEDAAKELARLKGVAEWKIDARDISDDFSTKSLPAKAAKLVQDVVDGISSAGAAAFGESTSQDGIESLASIASQDAHTIVSSVSSVGTEITSTLASQAEEASSAVTSLADDALSTPPGSDTKNLASTASSSVASVISKVSSSLDETSSTVSSAVSAGMSAQSASIREAISTPASIASSLSAKAEDNFQAIPSDLSSWIAAAVSASSSYEAQETSFVAVPDQEPETTESKNPEPSVSPESVESSSADAESSSQATLAPTDVESVLSSTSSRISRGMETEMSSLDSSRKVQSAISEAGDAYDQVTSSLASKMASVTESDAEPSIETDDVLSEPAEL